jgi:corrinoid protein of di/trimethylamine methyltransferase
MSEINRERVFKKLIKAVDLGDEALAEEGANEAVAEGVSPYDAIMHGLSEGRIVGDKYERKEYFLPDMLLSADAMYAGMNILNPHIPMSESKSKGKIILGVVEGDIHDIGKNIVKVLLTAAGYDVIDLGRDVPTKDFIEKAKSEGAQVIAMSTLMTPTLVSMQDVEERLDKEDIKGKIRTIIGGGSVSEEYRARIGSDAYGKDAVEAVSKIRILIDNIIAATESIKEENGSK